MTDYSLVHQLLERSDAVLQFEKFKAALEEEEKRRKEFREWITPSVKAEFIHGETIIHSPAKKRHWDANLLLSRVLSTYVDVNDLGMIGSEKVMIALTRNDYEPDIVYFSKAKAANFKEDQMLFPAPDLVIEILSPSTAKKDKTTKLEDYAYHQIPEYWIIDPVKQHLHKHILPTGSKKYFPAKIYQSKDFLETAIFPNLEIPIQAIFDKQINLKTIKKIMEEAK